MSFRDDLAAASEFVASYLEGVGDRPVVPAVEPGELRLALPDAPPEQGEPFADVLRDEYGYPPYSPRSLRRGTI